MSFKFLNFRFQVWFNSFFKFVFGFSLKFVLGPNNGKDSCILILIENALECTHIWMYPKLINMDCK